MVSGVLVTTIKTKYLKNVMVSTYYTNKVKFFKLSQLRKIKYADIVSVSICVEIHQVSRCLVKSSYW